MIRWAGTRPAREGSARDLRLAECCGQAPADDGELAEVADLSRVDALFVLDFPAVADRTDDFFSDTESLWEQPWLPVGGDQPGRDPEQKPLNAEVLICA